MAPPKSKSSKGKQKEIPPSTPPKPPSLSARPVHPLPPPVIYATRRSVQRPRADEEFLSEFAPLSKSEQNRRLCLTDNLPTQEFERRLRLLLRSEEEITTLKSIKQKNLFDKLRAFGDESNEEFYTFHERDNPAESSTTANRFAVSPGADPSELLGEIRTELFGSFREETHHMSGQGGNSGGGASSNSGGGGGPPGGNPPDLNPPNPDPPGDIPAWARDLFKGQQHQLGQLQQLLAGQAEQYGNFNSRPLKPDDIYEFRPVEGSQDDVDYFLFSERILDMTAIHGEDKVLPSLASCLKSSRAKKWMGTLSEQDKERLRTSTNDWIELLHRDFGIKPTRARQFAMREVFSFSQNRRALQYYENKVTWLKIAGIVDEPTICSEVREGLKDPQYRSLVRLGEEPTLAKLRNDMLECEDDAKALWRLAQQQLAQQRPAPFDRQRRPPVPQQQNPPPNAYSRGRGYPQRPYQPSQPPSQYQPQPPRNTSYRPNQRGNYAPQQARNQRFDSQGQQGHQSRPPLAIASNDSPTPPRPCRFCGQNHWDRECPNYNPATFHMNVDYDYEQAQDEALSSYNFNPYVDNSAPSQDYYDHYYTNEDEQPPQHYHQYDYYYDHPQQYHLPSTSSHYDPPSLSSVSSFAPQPSPSAASVSTPSPESSHTNSPARPPSPTQSRFGKSSPSVAPPSGSSDDIDSIGTYLTSSDSATAATCVKCKKQFPSRNKLFRHLEKSGHSLRDSADKSHIIESSVSDKKIGSGLAYRDYSYAEIQYQLSTSILPQWGCLDTGGPMSLIDEKLLDLLPVKDRRLTPPVDIAIKGVGGLKRSTNAVVLDVFLPDVSGTRLAKIKGEFHIVDELDCGVLIGQDIIHPNGFVVDSQRGRATIRSCKDMVCRLKVCRASTLT